MKLCPLYLRETRWLS